MNTTASHQNSDNSPQHGSAANADETGVLNLSQNASESVGIFMSSPRLIVRNPVTRTDEAFVLKPGENTVGRNDDNSIVLNEIPRDGEPHVVSRNHARIVLDPTGVVTVYDLRSRNGIYINNERLAEGGSHVLDVNDTVSFGAPNHFRTSVMLPHQMQEVRTDARYLTHQPVGEKSLETAPPLRPGQDQVIELQRQLRAVQRQAHSQQLLLASIQEAQDRYQMFQKLSEVLVQIFPNADRCTVLTRGEKDSWTDKALSYADGADQARPISISRTIINEIQRTGEAILSNQVMSDLGESESLLNQRVHSLMCCPFRYNGEIVGLIQLDSEESGADFVLEDLKLLAQAAHVAELANTSAEARAEAEREKHMLRRIGEEQSMSFPDPVQSFDGVDAAFLHRPLKNAAGDFYDIVTLGEKRTGFLLVDVSGHDSAAAIWGAEMKGRLNTALQRIAHEDSLTEVLPAAVAMASDEMHIQHKAGRFATGIIAAFDSRDTTIELVNSGHDPLLVYDSEQQTLITLTPTEAGTRLISAGDGINLPMGIADSHDMDGLYSTEKYQLKSGDVLLGFTDGFTETANAAEEMFGKDRLTAVFTEAVKAGLTPEQIVTSIHQQVTAFAAEINDDLSAFVLRIL